MGRFAEALKIVKQAIDLDPSLVEAYRLLGFILLQMGDPLKARDEYAKAADLGDESKAELILVQAKTALDPTLNIQSVLSGLKERFPNDKLIEEAITMNFKSNI